MEIKPDYYDEFTCIAAECQHNCCIGWEIDIDDETLEKYQSANGTLKEKLHKSISLSPCAHFVLTENERCPFLNKENLCELILYGGENMLCSICREHPRFYNQISGITEKGLGLSCEVAAKIILSRQEKFTLVNTGKDFPQNDFFTERAEIFAILQDRSKPLSARISELLEWANISSPINKANWPEIYKGLERLDSAWDKHLDSISFIEERVPEQLEIPYEQLLCYFIYRHLRDDFLFAERIQFAVLSCYLIASANKSGSLEEMLEIARIYSSEIEYSDENLEILLEKLQELGA